MIKDVNCPTCKKALPLGEFIHDSKFNLICNFCKNVVFSADGEKNHQIKLLRVEPTYQKKEPLPIKMNIK